MKKRIRIITAIVMVMLILVSNVAFAKPKFEELDPKNWITLPIMISSKTAHITVSSEAGTHTLYYQIQYLTDSQYASLENKQSTFKTELARKKEAVEVKQAEYNTVVEKYNEEGKTGTVSEATKQEYLTVKEAYEAVAKEYVDYAKAAQEELMLVIPDFVEADWKQSNDGTANIDYGNKTGNIHFVLWAKVVAGGETYYDMTVYSTNVTGEESVAIAESSIQLKVGQSQTLTVTHNNGNQSLVWESSDETIAEVDANGKVTAVREGTAIISVKLIDGSSRDTCQVTVSKEDSGNNGQTNDPPKGNITIPAGNNNTTGGGSTNTAGNKPTGINGNMDNTKASGNIPQTGVNYTVVLIVAGFAIAGGFGYYKYRKYNF